MVAKRILMDVGCGMWDVGCGMWDVQRERDDEDGKGCSLTWKFLANGDL